jgi:hypothetical protein
MAIRRHLGSHLRSIACPSLLADTQVRFANNGNPFRFSKLPPILKSDRVPSNLSVHKDIGLLGSADYPLDETKVSILRGETTADSVVTIEDPQLNVSDPVTEYKDCFKTPLYPEDGKDFYNDQMWPVVKAQIMRNTMEVEKTKLRKPGRNIQIGKASKLNRWPDLWYDRETSKLNPFTDTKAGGKLTLNRVAEAVQGEFSNYHQQTVITKIAKAETKVEAEDFGQPFRGVKDFIGMEVRMAQINAWALEVVAADNFFLKWHYGVPRPEEVAWRIKNGELTAEHGVPQKIIDIIGPDGTMKFGSATAFTAYTNGCPTHPSFPAMHSAASTCSLWLPVMYNISEQDYLEALRMDYAVSYARTVAGVHYPQDNFAGLNIGQQIIVDKLPDFLADNYGYDRDMVAQFVKDLSFDWETLIVTQRNGRGVTGINEKEALDRLRKARKNLSEARFPLTFAA